MKFTLAGVKYNAIKTFNLLISTYIIGGFIQLPVVLKKDKNVNIVCIEELSHIALVALWHKLK